MKNIFLFIFCCLCTSNVLAKEEFVIAIGDMLQINTQDHGKVFNTNSKVVKLFESKKGLYALAKSEGVSEVALPTRSIRIVVFKQEHMHTFKKMRTKLTKTVGLNLNYNGRITTITGDLLRFSDWVELSKISQESEFKYQIKANIQNEVITQFTKHIGASLKRESLPIPNYNFEFSSQAIITNANKIKNYEKILNPWGVEVVANADLLSIDPLVGVRILVTEVRKNSFQRLGIKWPASYNAQLLDPSSKKVPLELSIEAIEQGGLGRILASPHLICKSGKEATFLAGGEIPIRVSSYKSSQVIWKKYGILLGIKPKADFSGKMSIEVSTEISNIDPSTTIDGVPGFLTNQMQTHFDLDQPRTILLSGLLKKDSSTASEGLPFLTRLPILGKLFSSQEYRNNQTELVIMVTPKVLSQESLENHSNPQTTETTND